ncbi:MAG: zinc-ribbon domain-containing protein [Collinsella sp.]
MFCSQCGAPMGDNDKFCGVCGAPNTEVPHASAGSVPQGQPQPQPFVAPQPAMNVPKGCMAQAFNDMLKVPGALVRVCQIAFLPALICVVSVLVLFIPVIGGIAAAIGFLLAYVASVCGAGFAIEWGRDLSLKDDNGMERPLLRSTSFGLGIFSSVITGVLEFVAIIPVIGVIFSAIESVVIGAVGSYYYSGSSGLEAALFGSMGLLVFAVIVSVVLGIFFKMFGDAAVMHFAVVGRVESAFSLEKVWKSYKANLGKLFCASILPEFLTGIVSHIITWIFTAIFGAIATFGMYSYYYRPTGLEAIIEGGGITLILFLMIIAFVTVFLTVFGKMLKYRAVGYWAARHASEWADEDADDVLTFVLPGEKKPAPAGSIPRPPLVLPLRLPLPRHPRLHLLRHLPLNPYRRPRRRLRNPIGMPLPRRRMSRAIILLPKTIKPNSRSRRTGKLSPWCLFLLRKQENARENDCSKISRKLVNVAQQRRGYC